MPSPSPPVAASAASPPHSASHDAEWAEFQAFVAAVDKPVEDTKEDPTEGKKEEQEEEEDDDRAQDAEQSLENVAYVDRYRQALEQSAPAAKDASANGTKRVAETDAHAEEAEVAKEDVAAIVRAAVLESAKRRKVQHPSSDEEDEDNSVDNDALDLSNWRSKRLS